MYAIFKREIFSLLNAMVASIIIGIFLLATGVLLWFFPDTSLLEYGYADLGSFFSLAPFLFMFLIPAVCMRVFAEERREGTYLLLATRPVTAWEIIMAKYFACIMLVIFALLPTLIYYYSIYQLGMPEGNIDSGAVIGSYIGLFLLGSSFTAVGVFASSLTRNQVVAFAIGVFVCFFTYSGLQSMAGIGALAGIEEELTNLGINAHYESISRGVLDTRDLVYFLSYAAVFLGLCRLVIGGRKW
jgi:ABC-2 type transport system permease protein